MSPTRRLHSIPGGCKFDWLDDRVRAEAAAVLDLDKQARSYLQPLIDRLESGRARKGADYKQMQSVTDEPPVYELILKLTKPQLRLYFTEVSHDDGVHAVGLLLAVKPAGTPAEQREAQNQDIATAAERRGEM